MPRLNSSAVADPAAGWEGPRNMKSMWPSLVAICFIDHIV